MHFLGVMQQELEHQRQLMELMQQMQQQMRQMQHREQQAHEAQTQQGASPSGGNEWLSQQSIMKGFDKIEVFSGGDEQWQNWSWKIKTAVSGMNEVFAEMLTTAEADGIESIEEVLREAKFVDANRERGVKAGKEMYGVLARYTNSEALTIVKSVSEMDRVRAWARFTCELQQKNTLGRMFRVQRECMYPKPVKDVGQVRLAIMQWEEKWKVMMSELEEGANEDPGSMENVGVVGDLPKGCEGANVVEVGRSRRELREPQGEGDIVHVEQGRTVARSKGNSSADGARLRQWK